MVKRRRWSPRRLGLVLYLVSLVEAVIWVLWRGGSEVGVVEGRLEYDEG